ncbi:MAG: response regulator transcription factor [Elusimicrobia bacterium]|nr:response regulator transcription factor [Elusimicrobiota bacterium]
MTGHPSIPSLGPRPSGGRIRVLLADDHSVVREGIKAVLKKTAADILVVAEASNGTAALDLARRTEADIYVLDISMPSLNGLETMARLLHRDKKTKVIMLSMHDDRPTIEKALRAGARGYVIKESAAEDIAPALRAVHRGQRYLSPSASSVELADLIDASSGDLPMPSAGLTSKEREIIQLIAEGLGNKQVARKLGITENTVHVHRHNIAVKLDIHKQTDLVRYAVKERIVAL